MNSFEEHSPYIAKGSLLLTLLPLIPFPLVDFFLESIIARKMLKPLFKQPTFVRFFLGRENFCLGCIWGLIMYPILKLVKIIRFFIKFKRFIYTFYFWFFKGYLIFKVHQEFPDQWLNDAKIMSRLAKDMDGWLTSQECTSLVNQQAVETFQNLKNIRDIFKSWEQNSKESMIYLLQHQSILDEWVHSWKNQHDTPQ